MVEQRTTDMTFSRCEPVCWRRTLTQVKDQSQQVVWVKMCVHEPAPGPPGEPVAVRRDRIDARPQEFWLMMLDDYRNGRK